MLLTRTFEVDSGSMSRSQLGRRDTQTSENFWADIRNLSLNEKSDVEPLALKERIRFNVSGTMFETFSKTLNRFPDTLLGSNELRVTYYDPEDDVYFFDRNRDAFESILFFYQSYGKLIKPTNLGLKLFIEELKFFQMGEDIINRFMVTVRYPEEDKVQQSSGRTICGKIWNFLEAPKSKPAMAVAFFSVAMICISVIIFCMETLPMFKSPEYAKTFDRLEAVCVAWFTLELLLRFATAPNKFTFIKSFMNFIDLVSILPFYMTIFSSLVHGSKQAPRLEFLRVIRLARVLRVFKLSRHLRIFKILGLTLKSSFRELMLLLFFVLIAVVLFSSAAYYADPNFKSIPNAFWFAIITLTNVGYGDSVPTNAPGKIIASLCAICGIIVLALPIPIVVSSFMYFYNLEKENQKLEKQDKQNQKRMSMMIPNQDNKPGLWSLHKLLGAKVSPDPSQTGDEEDTLSNASEEGIQINSVPLDQTLS